MKIILTAWFDWNHIVTIDSQEKILKAFKDALEISVDEYEIKFAGMSPTIIVDYREELDDE